MAKKIPTLVINKHLETLFERMAPFLHGSSCLLGINKKQHEAKLN